MHRHQRRTRHHRGEKKRWQLASLVDMTPVEADARGAWEPRCDTAPAPKTQSSKSLSSNTWFTPAPPCEPPRTPNTPITPTSSRRLVGWSPASDLGRTVPRLVATAPLPLPLSPGDPAARPPTRPTPPTLPKAAAETAPTAYTKPPLLSHLETFINGELSLIPGSYVGDDTSLNTERTRVYLSAFKLFISSSKVYGPVLDSILKELEIVLEAYERVMSIKGSVLRDTAAIRKECDEKVEALRAAHHKEKEEWKGREREMARDIACKNERIDALEAEVRELKRMEKLCTEKWCEERERVLVMVNQMREAEEVHQDAMIEFEKLKRESLNVQDLAKLHQNTADELQQLKKSFATAVPLRQHELLQQMLKEKSEQAVQMKVTMANLRKKVEMAEKAQKAAIKQVEELEADCQRLRCDRGNSTPRPGWQELVQEFEAPLDYEGRSTHNMARELLEQLKEANSERSRLESELEKAKQQLGFLHDEGGGAAAEKPESTDFFVGMGTGKDVPKYLRWFGQVKNRNMSKREVEAFIADFWAARRRELDKLLKQKDRGTRGSILPETEDSSRLPKIRTLQLHTMADSIEDFMYNYLKAKHGLQPRVVEKAYNVLHTCRKYIYDGDCELFLLILEGHLPEAVYYEQVRMLERFQRKLEELEMPGPTGKRVGKVKKAKVNQLLDKLFSSKSDRNLVRLKYVLSKEFPGEEVVVNQLFAEDRHGNQCEFLELMRNQMVREVLEYVQDVSNAIFMACGEDTELPLSKVRECILDVDPSKPQKDLERMVANGLGVPEGSAINWDQVVTLEDFLRSMKRGYMFRHSKAPDASPLASPGSPPSRPDDVSFSS